MHNAYMQDPDSHCHTYHNPHHCRHKTQDENNVRSMSLRQDNDH